MNLMVESGLVLRGTQHACPVAVFPVAAVIQAWRGRTWGKRNTSRSVFFLSDADDPVVRNSLLFFHDNRVGGARVQSAATAGRDGAEEN